MAIWRDLNNPTNLITMSLACFVEEMAEHRIYSTANEGLDTLLKVLGMPAFLPLVVAFLIVFFAYLRGRSEVGKDDPRIYLESLEKGEGMSEILVLRNLGGDEAHNVRLAEIKPAETKIDFAPVPLIPVGERATSFPNQQNQGTILRRNLTHELQTAWGKRTNSKDDTFSIKMTTTYENRRNIVFETQCDLVFHGVKNVVGPEFYAKEIVQFANWRFKRLGKRRQRHEPT